MGDKDLDPRACRGVGCGTLEDVMGRQIGSKEIRLCPDCADRRRSIGEQDRAGDPPQRLRRRLSDTTLKPVGEREA